MLEIDKLACVRGSRLLFRQLNTDVKPGDLLRVTGANGAGKTSLLRMLCGMLEPSAGEVRWHHEKLRNVREQYARSLLYIGHAAGLKDDLTAGENLQVAETLAGRSITAAQARIALTSAGLPGRDMMPARQLSQGQKRRVHLARTILPSAPVLWILDEPFTALDNLGCEWLSARISAHLKKGGSAILTSHQPVSLESGITHKTIAL